MPAAEEFASLVGKIAEVTNLTYNATKGLGVGNKIITLIFDIRNRPKQDEEQR